MPAWTRFSSGSVRWQVHPAWQDVLFDNGTLRLAQWRDAGVVETIKEAPHRSVYRVHVPDRAIYFKHYPIADLRSKLRQVVRTSKGRNEFECALAIASRQVATFEPLAVGETPHGESFLITRAIEEAEPLNRFLEQTLPAKAPGERQRMRLVLTEALARFLAHTHNVGVVHPDLHAGNILVRWDPEVPPKLYLIDLHAVRLRGPLTWRQSRDNLVMINRWFVQRSHRPNRRRFWRSYVKHRRGWNLSEREERQRALELERATWNSCLRFWRGRDHRCLRTNRYFYRMSGRGCRAWAVRDLPAETLRRLLHDLDNPLTTQTGILLKDSPRARVVKCRLEPDGQARRVIYKRFHASKWTDPWFNLVRGTPAQRSWVSAFRLLDCGIPTARPLAVIERRRFGIPGDCYLITEKIQRAVELRDYVDRLAELPGAERHVAVRRLADQLGRLLRALHDRQLSHRDLKAANILVSPRGKNPGISDEVVQLTLIDLVGLERWRRLPHSRRVQNLGRLHASFHCHPKLSRTDKLRFLRAYLRWGLFGKKDWKAWWRQIARATRSKIARNRRRGRPLS